MRYIFLF